MLKELFKMRKKRFLCYLFAVLGIVLLTSCQKNNKSEGKADDITYKKSKPYLELVAAQYLDKEDKSKGVKIYYCLYSIEEGKMVMKEALLPAKCYPVSCLDPKRNKIYYSASAGNDDYENLFVYDIEDRSSKQVTKEKMLYNDLFVVGDNLYANVATTGKTVTQPAVIELDNYKFRYLNENDDDTWIFSFSYSFATNDLLYLTCSDSGMRTRKVCEETFIRPKKIYSMDLDFSNRKLLYETDKYEICETRQLGKDRLIIIYSDKMGTEKKLKIIELGTKKEYDLKTEGMKFDSIYPDSTGENVYIWGLKNEQYAIYEYSLKEDKIIKTLTKKELLGDEDNSVINFKYTMLDLRNMKTEH